MLKVGDIVRLKRTHWLKAQLRGAKVKVVALEPYLQVELLETRKDYRGFRHFRAGESFALFGEGDIAYHVQG
jgi:hypothetical protein